MPKVVFPHLERKMVYGQGIKSKRFVRLKPCKKNRAKVLDFYNQRRKNAAVAKPNAAHPALVELEKPMM